MGFGIEFWVFVLSLIMGFGIEFNGGFMVLSLLSLKLVLSVAMLIILSTMAFHRRKPNISLLM